MNVHSPAHPHEPAGTASKGSTVREPPALFSAGFRPFFLLAAIHAALVIPGWMLLLHGTDWLQSPLDAMTWHGHEMLFGFVMAVIAGFLLTAIPNWTGRPPFAGMPLLILTLAWIAGRLVVTLDVGFSPTVVAIVDLMFPLALMAVITPALLRGARPRNAIFLLFLTLLLLANTGFHFHESGQRFYLLQATNVVLLILTIIGGRIIPAFTTKWLSAQGSVRDSGSTGLIDRVTIAATVAVLVGDALIDPGTLTGIVAAVAAIAHLVRLSRWQGYRTVTAPILFVLHMGYAWIPLALGLKAAWLLGLLGSSTPWLHALTTGAFATMILAVMTRAALGHSGHSIIASTSTITAYVLLTLAALARVFGPLLFPDQASTWLILATTGWTAAFCLFLLRYLPICILPRADGKP